MKLLTLLVLFCLSATLYGCPKKKAEGEGAEPVEGASTADKSGEGSADRFILFHPQVPWRTGIMPTLDVLPLGRFHGIAERALRARVEISHFLENGKARADGSDFGVRKHVGCPLEQSRVCSGIELQKLLADPRRT